MGFLGFGRPKWKHQNADVRLEAVGRLAEDSQGTFAEIVRTDADPRVRAAAALRINEIPRLVELQKLTDPAVKRIATERLSGVADQWLRAKPLAECRPFLDHITDQKTLAELSVQAADAGVRSAAFTKFTAQPELSPALLTLVAIQDSTGDLAQQALSRIDKRALLKDIARKAKVEAVRTAAAARSEALGREADKPSAEQLRQARRKSLAPLMEQAVKLGVSTDWARITVAFEALTPSWIAARDALPMDEETTAQDMRFNRIRTDFITRRDAEHARIVAIGAARENYLAELAERTPLDPQDAGSHRQEAMFRWTSLGDLPLEAFMPMQSRFESELARLHPAASPLAALTHGDSQVAVVTLSAEAEARLAAIGEQAEGLITGGRDAKFVFQNLHKEWSKLSIDLRDSDPRRKRFTDAYAAWKNAGKERREQREDQTQERLKQMQTLVAEAESLATAGDAFGADTSGVMPEAAAVAPHAAACKELQAQWKAIGPVRFELSQLLRERFRAALDQAFVPVNATREAEEWERFTHLAHAEALIVKVLAFAELTDLSVVSAMVKQAHQEWKQLGPLPREKGQEAWGRFKAVCDAQFERCRPYFAELDAQRVTNLATKQALLAELQTLTTAETIGFAGSPADQMAKRTAHERIKAIQAEWKNSGPVPRENDAELWRGYRDVCDAYFAKHREHLTARNAEHGENLTRKLGLIVAVEDLAAQAEGGRTANSLMPEIKRLQQSWKAVGHVPKDQADAIWDKWRTACDRVYAILKPYLAELDAQRAENASKKDALIAEVEDLAKQENARWFKDDVIEIQQKWRDIGHVPRERMDELADRFRAACDKILSQ